MVELHLRTNCYLNGTFSWNSNEPAAISITMEQLSPCCGKPFKPVTSPSCPACGQEAYAPFEPLTGYKVGSTHFAFERLGYDLFEAALWADELDHRLRLMDEHVLGFLHLQRALQRRLQARLTPVITNAHLGELRHYLAKVCTTLSGSLDIPLGQAEELVLARDRVIASWDRLAS